MAEINPSHRSVYKSVVNARNNNIWTTRATPPQCSRRQRRAPLAVVFKPSTSTLRCGPSNADLPTDRSRCRPPRPSTAVRRRAPAHPCRERDAFGDIVIIVRPVSSSFARLRLRRRTKRWTSTRVNSSSNAKTTSSSIAEAFESTTGRTLRNRPRER